MGGAAIHVYLNDFLFIYSLNQLYELSRYLFRIIHFGSFRTKANCIISNVNKSVDRKPINHTYIITVDPEHKFKSDHSHMLSLESRIQIGDGQ